MSIHRMNDTFLFLNSFPRTRAFTNEIAKFNSRSVLVCSAEAYPINFVMTHLICSALPDIPTEWVYGSGGILLSDQNVMLSSHSPYDTVEWSLLHLLLLFYRSTCHCPLQSWSSLFYSVGSRQCLRRLADWMLLQHHFQCKLPTCVLSNMLWPGIGGSTTFLLGQYSVCYFHNISYLGK